MTDYSTFLASKIERAEPVGFDADPRCAALFPWQRECVRWALRQGRAALLEDTGLGKTVQQLAWADEVAHHTGGRVLILAPLAVGAQTAREAARFGIDGVAQDRDGTGAARIAIANYESLHKFHADDFAGVVLDESSILKAFMGSRKRQLVDAFARTPYRLCCTATPAPNDHEELGNHAEFLGIMDRAGMLARWFVHDSGTLEWRLKRHGIGDFWRWVTSWARCVGRPSDLGGYSDDGYVLPPLDVRPVSVAVDLTDGRQDGALFRRVDGSATALHRERRRTADARAEAVTALVRAEPDEAWLVWVETDYDAAAVLARLPDAIEVAGRHDDEEKARRLLGFADGDIRVLVTKPRIGGFGMNWQHCARVLFVGQGYSWEAFYQCARRCWRFGQRRPVRVHVMLAETEVPVWRVLMDKAAAHDAMKDAMFSAAREAQSQPAARIEYAATHIAPIPAWLRSSPEVT